VSILKRSAIGSGALAGAFAAIVYVLALLPAGGAPRPPYLGAITSSSLESSFIFFVFFL
jgi:hypothetical protein